MGLRGMNHNALIDTVVIFTQIEICACAVRQHRSPLNFAGVVVYGNKPPLNGLVGNAVRGAPPLLRKRLQRLFNRGFGPLVFLFLSGVAQKRV